MFHKHPLIFLHGYSEKTPHLVSFYDTLGIRRTYSHLKPPGFPRGGKRTKKKYDPYCPDVDIGTLHIQIVNSGAMSATFCAEGQLIVWYRIVINPELTEGDGIILQTLDMYMS